MTRIEFLHSAADRIQSASLWLQQAWGLRQRVLVYVPDRELATRLDRILWTQPALSFVPHCHAADPLAAETAILLTDQLDSPPQESCLLNLDNQLPPGFSRFERLIEIVGVDAADRLPARERFKFYRERGYAIDSRDISGGF
jgi:DNA polymerase III subunit chi